MKAKRRVMAIALTHDQLAIVFLIHGKLKLWRKWRQVASNGPAARSQIRTQIAKLKPDLVVIENPDGDCRKGKRTRAILRTLIQTIGDEGVAGFLVERVQRYANRYEEAAALAAKHPEIRQWLPPHRPAHHANPKNLVLFEALALLTDLPSDTIPEDPVAATCSDLDGGVGRVRANR